MKCISILALFVHVCSWNLIRREIILWKITQINWLLFVWYKYINTPGTAGGPGGRDRTLARREREKDGKFVITMAKLCMAHASTHGASKPPGPKRKRDWTMVITMASYALQRHLGWRTQSRLGQLINDSLFWPIMSHIRGVTLINNSLFWPAGFRHPTLVIFIILVFWMN